jgi:hypothetical protein
MRKIRKGQEHQRSAGARNGQFGDGTRERDRQLLLRAALIGAEILAYLRATAGLVPPTHPPSSRKVP